MKRNLLPLVNHLGVRVLRLHNCRSLGSEFCVVGGHTLEACRIGSILVSSVGHPFRGELLGHILDVVLGVGIEWSLIPNELNRTLNLFRVGFHPRGSLRCILHIVGGLQLLGIVSTLADLVLRGWLSVGLNLIGMVEVLIGCVTFELPALSGRTAMSSYMTGTITAGANVANALVVVLVVAHGLLDARNASLRASGGSALCVVSH